MFTESNPVPTIAPKTQRDQGVTTLNVSIFKPAIAAIDAAIIDPNNHARGTSTKKSRKPPANPSSQLYTVNRFIIANSYKNLRIAQGLQTGHDQNRPKPIWI